MVRLALLSVSHRERTSWADTLEIYCMDLWWANGRTDGRRRRRSLKSGIMMRENVLGRFKTFTKKWFEPLSQFANGRDQIDLPLESEL